MSRWFSSRVFFSSLKTLMTIPTNMFRMKRWKKKMIIRKKMTVKPKSLVSGTKSI